MGEFSWMSQETMLTMYGTHTFVLSPTLGLSLDMERSQNLLHLTRLGLVRVRVWNICQTLRIE